MPEGPPKSEVTELTLGDRVQDKITGATGVLTRLVTYISGCNQGLIALPVGADGKLPDGLWFDVQRLEVIEPRAVVLDNGATPGCDTPAPVR